MLNEADVRALQIFMPRDELDDETLSSARLQIKIQKNETLCEASGIVDTGKVDLYAREHSIIATKIASVVAIIIIIIIIIITFMVCFMAFQVLKSSVPAGSFCMIFLTPGVLIIIIAISSSSSSSSSPSSPGSFSSSFLWLDGRISNHGASQGWDTSMGLLCSQCAAILIIITTNVPPY